MTVKRFELGTEITPEQREHLDEHGYLVFGGVATNGEVGDILSAVDDIDSRLAQGATRKVNGVPLFRGRGLDNAPFVQRLPFTSTFSDVIRDFVHDQRFEPIRTLIGASARVGDREKDGVVLSRYINVPGSVYPRLGWHTDGLRDLFYLRMPQQMLNVGLHLDNCTADDGGLRLIPGSHTQGLLSMCFRKPYFVSHGVDPKEVVVETRAGDVTIHDGRLWHRVQRSAKTGRASLRRVMFVPYLTDAYQPKDEHSTTPVYHYLSMLMCWFKRLQRA